MRKFYFFLLLISSLTQPLHANIIDPFEDSLPFWLNGETEDSPHFDILQNASYHRPAHIDLAIWNSLSPYFLPENHPIKMKLDLIFSASRVSHSSKTLKKAGFKTPEPRNHSHTIVTKHPKLKGYLLKLFADNQTDRNDGKLLLKRLNGAKYTRESIESHGYQSYFKVPRKWIYILPKDPAPVITENRKNFILVVEDMGILVKKQNRNQWLNAMSPSRLNALYVVLQEAGLDDSIHTFNVPFCKDGLQAFIDTERYQRWPVAFDRLTMYLPKKLRPHWEGLIRDGGP